MPAKKEKIQQAVLATIIFVFTVLALFSLLPGVALMKLWGSINEIQTRIDAEKANISAVKKAQLAEKHIIEEVKADQTRLAVYEAQLLQKDDPYLPLLTAISNEAGGGFEISLLNWNRGAINPMPPGTRLPCNIYRARVTIKGNFFELGKFLAHLENKYPLFAVKGMSLRAKSPEDPECQGELELGVLTKKE